jgi:hypothetical protein
MKDSPTPAVFFIKNKKSMKRYMVMLDGFIILNYNYANGVFKNSFFII